MKLSAIRKLCVKRKVFFILNDARGGQWLSDGCNAYPVEGVQLDRESIPAIFDLGKKEADKIRVIEISEIDDRFSVEPMAGERELTDWGAVWYMGELYRVLGSEEGLMLAPVDALKPAERKDGLLKFCERPRPDGNILIACYADMLVSGIVSPVDTKAAEAVMARMQALAVQGVRVSASPQTDAEAEAAERAAEEAVRRDQQKMDLGDGDDAPEDEEP